MTKRRLIIALVAVLLLVAAPITVFWLLHRPLPPLDGRAAVSGLDKSVEVTFDGRAIPYIDAHTDSDAYVAQGYVTARDRMYQMDIMRRTATGQMAEIFGASWLPTDRLVHTLGIKHLAYAEFNKLSPAAKAALEAYARGVNDYLSEYGNNLPLQCAILGYAPRTWHAEDSLAILKYEAYKMDESWRLDDFRQRVANRAGDQVQQELFRDDLVPFGLPGAKQPEETAGETSKGAGKQKTGETKGKGSKSSSTKQQTQMSDKSKTSATTNSKPADVNVRAPKDATPQNGAFLPAADKLLAELSKRGDIAEQPMHIDPMAGSTSWAVPARATHSGGAMLGCNKDGPLTSPSEWYLCSLNSPGMHVAGAAMPGVPGIMVGRNENIAWGSSALRADVQDIFLEQFKSQFDTSYRTPNGWANADVTTDIIPVRFGKDVEHKVISTNHGPLLLRSGNLAVSVQWTGFNTDISSFDSIYRMNRAGNADEFVQSLSKFCDPPMMFVYADRFGNVGCHAAGQVPVRAGGGLGTKLNAGWEPKGAWQSMVAFDKLPGAVVTYSPSAAAPRMPLVAANQQPGTTSGSLPQMDDGLMLGHQWSTPYRANRLLDALTAAQAPVTLGDMAALDGDEYSAVSTILTNALKDAGLKSQTIERNGVHAIELLTKWDGQLRADSIEGSIYESFMQTLTRRLVEPKIGREMATEYMQRWPLWLTLAHSVLQNKPPQWLAPEERTYDCFFMTTLSQALKSLHITFDSSKPGAWQWGKIHQAVFQQAGGGSGTWLGSLYRLGPVPVGGAPECINSCDVAFDPAALQFGTSNGPAQRMIIDMADPDKFYQSVNSGQSGQLFSSNRNDQMKSWTALDLLPVAFSSDQLMRQAKHRLTLDTE